MTESEPIPALVYHQPQLGRRPLFVALAILAIVFGLLAAITSVAMVISYFGILSSARMGGSSAAMRVSIIPTIFSEAIRAPAYLALLCAGIGYFLKARWIPTALAVYISISLLATFVGLIAGSVITAPVGSQVAAVSSVTRFIPSIARAVFDVAMLVLLLNATMRQLINQATGIDELALPDHLKA